MRIEDLKRQAHGKWAAIYSALGIIVGDGSHTACPICGPGNNSHRFRMDNKTGNGDWICTHCNAGDGITLVMKSLNKTLPDAIQSILSVIGIAEYAPALETPKKDPRLALKKVWESSKPLTGSDMVSRYLHSRKLTLRPENVRFCPACYESDTKTNLPAMVARVMDQTGKPVTIHRTYLNGIEKADIKSPKKLMPGTATINGAAIRLFTPGGLFQPEFLGVAEGIETAIAAAQKFQIATWACISANGLETFIPPPEYKKIMVMGDADTNFIGQKAAYTLASRLHRENLIVGVMMPEKGDWND